jgi:hypothetical protein
MNWYAIEIFGIQAIKYQQATSETPHLQLHTMNCSVLHTRNLAKALQKGTSE